MRLWHSRVEASVDSCRDNASAPSHAAATRAKQSADRYLWDTGTSACQSSVSEERTRIELALNSFAVLALASVA
jgi:hypothetical protein